MKKNSSMQGTLNKLFGRKNTNDNSLYAENPPWMKPQGVKKAAVDYHDEMHNSFAFLDDSGTATLRARPGPRSRPVLQFSTSNTDAQGRAVPTPSIPSGYSNISIGNGPKLNGNYRMYSSVGDLRAMNYHEHLDEEIPAPPSMPPPPPPTMIPAPLPQESPPSSTVSSPVSPSLPDFIPPTPNSSATTIPNYEPSTGTYTVSNVSEQHQAEGSKEMPMTLPNRFSLNTVGFQHNHGQTTNDVDPQSSLSRTFKVPPPAPVRTTSVQLQEHQNISYSTEPPPSPVPSSFNPSVQARLFSSNQGQKSLNDTLNKRKSMLIMEDLQNLSQKDNTIQRNVSIIDSTSSGSLSLKSSMNTKTPTELDIESKKADGVLTDNRWESEPGWNDVQKQRNKIDTNGSELPSVVSGNIKDGAKRPLNSIEFNKISFNKDGFASNGHKSTKDTVKVLSVKPISTDLSFSYPNVQPKQNSLTSKLINTKELTGMENDIKMEKEKSAEIIHQESSPTPPPMPPPPPPTMTPPKPPAVPPPPPPPATVIPQKTFSTPNFVAPPPAPPLLTSMQPVPQASPMLPPKPKTISATSTSPMISPPSPKAPPTPPPLPSQTGTSTAEPQLPLLKALQEKQETLKQSSKKSIEVRPAHISSIDVASDDKQKARVGKIKGELEALFSPKKDEKVKDLKNSRPSQEPNKKVPNGNTQRKGGENTIVTSLMMKVPLMPPVSDKEDVDGDTSDWIPKSNNTNFHIPEPDYLPIKPTRKSAAFSDVRSDIAKPTFETPSKPDSPLKATDVVSKLNDIPTYKPHHQRKASAGSLLLDKLPLEVSETTVVSLKKDEEIPYPVAISASLNSKYLEKQEEDINKYPVSGEQVDVSSPMALLMAAKSRGQKGSRSIPLERSSLPKMSVSSGIGTSSLTSQYNDVKTNTFIVVPKKESGGQFGQEEVTSFSYKPSSHLSNVSSSSKWTDGDFPSSSSKVFGVNPQKSDDEKTILMHVGEKIVEKVPKEERNEDLWKFKSSASENHNSANMSNFSDTYAFNIASVPSPVPTSKAYEDIDYGIIPPPAQFMNTPPSTDIDMYQKDRLYYGNNTKSDLGSDYEWNNESNRSLGFQTISNSSDFNKYTSDNYSSGISRDPHKTSLIKKRLYMPDPESSGSYGRNANSLRSSALPVSYGHMHTQSSFTMGPESRHSNNPSRYISQGRRVSSENINKMAPTMTDMKYKPQNPEYGKSMSRQQSAYQQGMTFTVRPGTRQPISQSYQAGYL